MSTTIPAKSVAERSGSGLLSGSVLGFLARISGSFGTLISGMVLARMLSPSDLGIYMLLFNVVVIASILGTFGVGDASIRFIGQGREPARSQGRFRTAGQALAIGLCGMIFVMLFFPLTRDVLFHLDQHLTFGWREGVLIAIWIFTYGLLTTLAACCEALEKLPRARLPKPCFTESVSSLRSASQLLSGSGR